ncbi:Uncharacterized protein FWK35_00001848, partial [Aphis craccivora]
NELLKCTSGALCYVDVKHGLLHLLWCCYRRKEKISWTEKFRIINKKVLEEINMEHKKEDQRRPRLKYICQTIEDQRYNSYQDLKMNSIGRQSWKLLQTNH